MRAQKQAVRSGSLLLRTIRCDGIDWWPQSRPPGPHARRQRCWVHKLRKIACKVRRKNRKACPDQANLIYLAKNEVEARRRPIASRNTWAAQDLKAVACLEKDTEEMLEVFALPSQDWVRARTTNASKEFSER